MKLREIKEERRKQQRGTYAGVKYSPESVEALQKFMKHHKIPNPIAPNKIHTTLLYSRKYLPNYKPQGMLKYPLKARFKEYVVWKTSPPDPKQEPWNCLVMKIDCPELEKLHKKYMEEHDAEYDYDEYHPHITLSYNIGNLDVTHLPPFDGHLDIVEEYGENLNLDWANTHGTK